MDDIQTSFFKDLLTMDELRTLLKNQYSKPTIYRWIQKEGMPHIKIKGKIWFSEQALAQWLQGGSK